MLLSLSTVKIGRSGQNLSAKKKKIKLKPRKKTFSGRRLFHETRQTSSWTTKIQPIKTWKNETTIDGFQTIAESTYIFLKMKIDNRYHLNKS